MISMINRAWFYLIIASLIVTVVLNIFIADIFANIAEEKGHEKRTAFWLCFLFPIVGYLYVKALPDKEIQDHLQSIKQSLDELGFMLEQKKPSE